MKICSVTDSKGTTFTVNENDGKLIARALELQYLTKGNSEMVRTIMSMESATNTTLISGAESIASEIYRGKPVIFSRWMEEKQPDTYFPLV
jgi:hypothetical protein